MIPERPIMRQGDTLPLCRRCADGNVQSTRDPQTGASTVNVDTPDRGERTILFRGGAAFVGDSSAGIAVTRRNGVSISRIGPVESYEILDALIGGG